MDEGDRSGDDEEPDRGTGTVDDDTGNDGPDEDGSGIRDDRDSDGSPDDDFVGDGPADTGSADASSADGDDESDGDRIVSESDVGSSGENERVSGSGNEGGRFGGETDGDRTDTDGPTAELSRPETEPSRPEAEPSRNPSASDEGVLHQFRYDREGPLMWIREMLSSVAIVLVIGLLLFGVSGVWPPMVAVESGSMEPNMEVGDLVFVTEPGRLAPDAADNDIGVVTHEVGERTGYRTFGSYGSVVIYRPPGRTASPIIHRAMFHVEEGENWYDRADDRYHSAADCGELNHCPAPHGGFVTLGDDNGAYDQANGLAPPVRADWVTGVARVRVPYLGYVRLIATGQADPGDVVATTVHVQAGGVGIDEGYGGDSLESNPTVSGGKATVSGGAATAGAVG
ncbi:S26 family signal peptidase [Halorubrum sp. CSM-61]|uniref:S26 family signal peptidase n=1 Tax=Halorubrum sp. CSM-61 TaxID=2485838 RepID=UPI0013DE6F77|nr:S26 family signal peptidase [Halorubrum sp. CSM-61]